MIRSLTKLLVVLLFFACSSAEKNKSGLPHLGFHEVDPNHPGDTIYHTVPPFAFMDQHGEMISNENVKGKIYLANFFFTSCPTICPKMMSQLKRVHKLTEDSEIIILSHSIDPKRDSVERLKKYADDNGITSPNWHLLTGDGEEIYTLGMEGYNLSAMEDSTADGGYLHSEMVVLVDKEGHLRGMYEGTETKAMDRLLEDLKKLEKEYEQH
ncbi:MAG: SCO family protein [Flavobacteriales bacterium]|nr:SCO family protein [Flavobacteriales bacterium]